jgi:hypothetical protein
MNHHDEPDQVNPQEDEDTEGHSLGAALALSGIMSSRPRQPQYAKEDALPLDEPRGRSRTGSKAAASGTDKTSGR